MNTFLLLLNFLSIFLLLNTSKEAVLNNAVIEKWGQKKPKQAKIIALLVIILSFFTSSFIHGTTTGILVNFFSLSFILSLVILFNPLKVVNYKIIVLFFAISIVLEFLIN